MNLSTQAIGTWLTIPLIILVNSGGIFGKKWIEENIDEGQLDKYFFLLSIIMVVNQVRYYMLRCFCCGTCLYIQCIILSSQIMFYFISRGYKYKSQQELAIGFEDKDRTFSM